MKNYYRNIRRNSDLSPGEKLFLIELLEADQDGSGVIYPQDELAENLGVCTRQIRNMQTSLRDKGYLSFTWTRLGNKFEVTVRSEAA